MSPTLLIRTKFISLTSLFVIAISTGCSENYDTPPDTANSGTASENMAASTTAQPNINSTDVETFLANLGDSGYSGTVVIKHDEETITEHFGFADEAAGLLNGPGVVYDIGSITKQFTGAAILRLQMDGTLSTDDRLDAFFPQLPADKAEITIHQLLTHTAGVRSDLGDDYDPITRDAYMDLFAEVPLVGNPGEIHRYANVGYSVLAAVVEVASGLSYEQYLRDHLFLPAGMSTTGYLMPDWNAHTVAVGYLDGEALGRPHEQPWNNDGPGWHLRGNGGLLSTPEDMMRWHDALLTDDILDANAKSLYYQPHTTEGPGAGSFYGYGWALFPTVFDTLVVMHSGGNGVFFAEMIRFLEQDVTIFLTSNAARDSDEQISLGLIEAIFGLQAIDIEQLLGNTESSQTPRAPY